RPGSGRPGLRAGLRGHLGTPPGRRRPPVLHSGAAVMTRYELAADRAVEWLAAQLREDGSYGPSADDLACYYKSPDLFQLAGRTGDAARLLTFVQRRFMRADHDFTTAENHKSGDPAFTEYWAYPNGWLAMAAQRMGRFDVAYPAWEYLRSYHERARGGFF